MGGINVAIPGPGVVYDLRIGHRCDHEQSETVHKQRFTHTHSHTHAQKKGKILEENLDLSFNLVKVR